MVDNEKTMIMDETPETEETTAELDLDSLEGLRGDGEANGM